MNDTEKALFTFSPDKPVRQITNFIRAQIAGKGLEKSFALKTLEVKKSLDEGHLSLAALLNLLVQPADNENVIYALMYLDGSGFGSRTVNDLLVSSRQEILNDQLAYCL